MSRKRRSVPADVPPVIVPAGGVPGPGDEELLMLAEGTHASGSIAATLRTLFDQIQQRERDAEGEQRRLRRQLAGLEEANTVLRDRVAALEDVVEERTDLEHQVGDLQEEVSRLEAVLEAQGLAGTDLQFVLGSADPQRALRMVSQPSTSARVLRLVK